MNVDVPLFWSVNWIMKGNTGFTYKLIFEVVAYTKDVIFSSACYIKIIVLQITLRWFHKLKKKIPSVVLKKVFLFTNWYWHFQGISIFKGTAQNSRRVVFYSKSIINFKEQVNIPANLGIIYSNKYFQLHEPKLE